MERINSGRSTLYGKNIVISGASKGIGKSIAAAFAGEGSAVYLCARNEDTLNETVVEIQQQNPGSIVQGKPFDLSKKEDVIAFANWAKNEAKRTPTGRIDILVNNAGIFTPGNLYNETDGLLESLVATNLYSAYYLTRQLVQDMIEAKHGHIFNICSIASLDAYPNGGSYGITKYALLGFSKNLREELKTHHIKVTAVFPGAVMTDSWGNFDNSAKRIMEASDIAQMVIAAAKLSPQAVVEDIVMRPLLGDLP